jgi:hypothetical protein
MGGGVGIGIAGLSRVGALAASARTAAPYSRERVARTRRLGLWGEPDYAIISAEIGAEAAGAAAPLGQKSRFAASVRESGGMISMNFGRRWSQPLTVTILKRSGRSFTAAGLQSGRPATRPKQIEMAEGK